MSEQEKINHYAAFVSAAIQGLCAREKTPVYSREDFTKIALCAHYCAQSAMAHLNTEFPQTTTNQN